MSAYIGTPFADNTNLLNTTVSTVSIGTGIDVSGFATLLVQVSGSTFTGIITFERSLDNVYWSPALVTELNALNQKTQIETAGLYFVRTEAQYIRYNVTNISGSATIVIDGTSSIVSNADKLAWAMDDSNNSPLNVKLQFQNSGIKQDLSGAFILSDAPAPVTVTTNVTNTTNIIDTQGYQSIHITTGTTFAATAGVQYSNDGVTFTASTPLLTAGGTVNTGLATSTSYVSPCYGRFARIVATTQGSYTYFLRNYTSLVGQNLAGINGAAVAPTTAQLGMNIVQLGSFAVVTGGVNGTLGVGGTNAVGTVNPSANPVIIGGVDPLNTARRATTTMLGDLIIANRTIPSSNLALSSATTGNTPIGSAGYNNQIPQTIQDTSQYEGQSQVEILAQVLQELKIMNQQLYELPRIIAGQLNGINTAGAMPMFPMGDEPSAMRNDASLFDKQQ
jgi:hypothetical protein